MVRETWHEPPPWTDSPKKESFCEAPIAIFVTVPPELLVALHGKFDPSAARGLLSGLPYGGGVAMIMCPWAVELRRARAEKERMEMIEDILWLGNGVVLRSGRRISVLDSTGLMCDCDGVGWKRETRLGSVLWM